MYLNVLKMQQFRPESLQPTAIFDTISWKTSVFLHVSQWFEGNSTEGIFASLCLVFISFLFFFQKWSSPTWFELMGLGALI